MRQINLYIFLALVCGLTALPAAASESPLFENLATGAHETLERHRQKGKWLVVMIWAHDCEICAGEVGDYQRFHQRHEAASASVLGLTLDGETYRRQAVDFVRDHALEFPNLLAEPETVTGYYQIVTGSRWIGTPSFLIFGPDGELRARQAGAVEVEIVENFIASQSQ